MKKLSHLALAIGFAGICLTACTSYSAQDYVNDMKNLTEETLKNASTYTEEDWKRVGEEYRSINEKGKKVLENMTEDQRKELEKFSEDDIMEQANDFVDDIKQQLQDLKEENE